MPSITSGNFRTLPQSDLQTGRIAGDLE